MSLSQLAKSISESPTLKLNETAALLRDKGEPVIHLGGGEPKSKAPIDAIVSCASLLSTGDVKYTPADGIPALKKAIIRYTEEHYGRTAAAENVIASSGAKQSIMVLLHAILDPKEEVIFPVPYWVSYPEMVKLAGGVPVPVAALNGGFEPSVQEIAENIGIYTKAIIINSPNNPGGHAYSPAELKDLAEVAAKHPHLIVFSDEIYEKLVFDGLKSVSFATLHPDLIERTLTFNCHSKTFAMTGWRIGYIGGPKPVIDAINKLPSQMTSHITSFTQVPAALALTDPRGAESAEQMRRQFEKRARHIWQRLTALPNITCVRPQGAFYAFPNVSAYFGKTIGQTRIADAVSFSAALLEHNHVAVVPGNDSGFDTHVRLSFATSMEQIDKGVDRIGDFLKKLG